MSNWKSVLELDSQRHIVNGSFEAFQDAIRSGGDLRIYTEFQYNEHIDTNSDNDELVQEVSDFPTTYLINDHWAAGIMTFRMPIVPPDDFGPRPSMSFFMYNQDGRQAIARPFLDGISASGTQGKSNLDDHSSMPKFHQFDNWDADTNAPSTNFVYDFGSYRFLVCNDWEQVLSVSSDGDVISGSLDALVDAFAKGHELKVAVRGVCDDFGSDMEHELFVRTGPCYYNTRQKLLSSGTRPTVRVKPDIPMMYQSNGWDFGWLLVRTDGFVKRWLCNPYTLRFEKTEKRYAVRWFVR